MTGTDQATTLGFLLTLDDEGSKTLVVARLPGGRTEHSRTGQPPLRRRAGSPPRGQSARSVADPVRRRGLLLNLGVRFFLFRELTPDGTAAATAGSDPAPKPSLSRRRWHRHEAGWRYEDSGAGSWWSLCCWSPWHGRSFDDQSPEGVARPHPEEPVVRAVTRALLSVVWSAMSERSAKESQCWV